MTPPGRSARALRGVVTNYAASLLVAVTGFVLVPIVLRFISREEYGLWTTLGQAIAYFSLLDFGVGSALIRRTAQLRSEPDADTAISRALSTGVAVFAALGGIVLVAGLVMAALLPRLIHLPDGQASVARVLLLVLVIYTATAFPVRAALKTLYGLQEMASANLLAMLEGLLSPVIAVILLMAGVGLLSLPVATAGAGIVPGAIAFWLLASRTPPLRVRLSSVTGAEARDLFRWSALLWLNSLAVVIIYQTDNLVVASGAGLGTAAAYALTTRLPLYALPLIVVLADSCVPGAVELGAQGRIDRLRDVYVGVLRVTGVLAVGAALVAVTVNGAFVRLWVGAAQYGGFALTCFAAGILVYRVLMQTASIVVLGVGRLRGVVLMSLVEAALNLGLSVWWVRRFGAPGVAAGTLAAGLLTSGWFVTWTTARLLTVPVRELLWRGLGLPLACAAPAALLAAAMRPAVAQPGWLTVAGTAAVVGGVYALALLAAGTTRAEREALWRRVRRLDAATDRGTELVVAHADVRPVGAGTPVDAAR